MEQETVVESQALASITASLASIAHSLAVIASAYQAQDDDEDQQPDSYLDGSSVNGHADTTR